MEPIELFDIEAKISYPLHLNEAKSFEHNNPILEVSAKYDKEWLLQEVGFVDLITNRMDFEVHIIDNEIKSFFDISVIKNVKITGVDLNKGKLSLFAENYIENENYVHSEEYN